MNDGHRAPSWLLAVEIAAIVAILVAIGVAHFSRLSPAERLAIQLEAGMQLLYEMEMDHVTRRGRAFPPGDAAYRPYLPWMDTYDTEVRHDGGRKFSAVVRADLDGDGEAGVWRIDQTSPDVQRLQAD